jgi:hypothetical protein
MRTDVVEPEEPIHIPLGEKSSGNAKWVALAAVAVAIALGGWLWLERRREVAAAAEAQAKAEASARREEQARAERRKAPASGTPLSQAHQPPPGDVPAKRRIPSDELFRAAEEGAGAGLPTPLPGGRFTIRLPPDWDVVRSEGLTSMVAPKEHFRVIAAASSGDDDSDTERALVQIGAVNCNWRKGDGPKRGELGPGRVAAYFDEGLCGFTDGYGLVWLLRAYAGDDTTSLIARYSVDAGEDAEDRLIAVLRTIAPKG